MRIIIVIEDRRPDDEPTQENNGADGQDCNGNPFIASLSGVSALLIFCDGHLVRLFVVIGSMR
jgi:hypothetical protein